MVCTISVLYVDDESGSRELCKRYLERSEKFRVTTAPSVSVALDLLKSNSIQAIVSDYQMPGMDGIEFLKQVRATDKRIPFIIFTGKGWEAIAVEAFENGADFYLQKGDAVTPSSTYANLMHKITMAIEQRRVEQALVESELQYRRLFETAQDAILILDGESGEVIDANRFILELLGYPLEYFIGKHLWELGFIGDKSFAEQAFAELKTKGYIRYNDLPLKRKDGQTMEVEFISNSYLVGDKKIFQCNIRDITERKRHVMALADSESRYRRLLDVLNEGIWSIDEDALTTFVNPRMAEMLGYTVDEMLGKPLFSFMDEPAKKIAMENIERRQRGIKEQHDFEFLKKDGTRMYARLETAPISGNDGSYLGAIAAVQDITERKAAEEALKTFSEDLEYRVVDRTSALSDSNQKLMAEIKIRIDAEKELTKMVGEKDVLLHEVHHRVKNNLQIIASLLNLQIRKTTDLQTIEALKDSQSRVRSMSLVHEHLYRGKDFIHIDLGNYISALGMVLFSSYEAGNRGVRFDIDIHDIYVDTNTAIPLGLIINELITNSIKYAFNEKNGGILSITATEDPAALTLIVADNGAGMPEGITLENQTSLGLHLVSALTEQLNGTVTIDRTEGTKFTFTIPKVADTRGKVIM